MITLILCTEDVLRDPILYLSLYFKTNRQTYYDCLQEIRIHGDWEKWLRFFLSRVQETAEQAVQAAEGLFNLF